MITEERLLDMTKASRVLGISASTLYNWHSKGINLPFIKVGGALRVSGKDLEAFIKEGRVKPKREKKDANNP